MDCAKEYAKYVALNVLGMIGLSCYILADTYFVAKGLGSNGLAALNLAIPIYSFIHGCGLMLGIGGAARYSMLKHQEPEKEAGRNRIFTHTMLLAGCFAICFMAAGFLGAGMVTRLLGADEHVFSMCKTYLQILLVFSPAFLTNDVLLCFVRNDGAPGLVMAAMLAGSFSNIILDYFFIFRLHMGIFGAVFATGLAPVISLAVLASFFARRKNQFHWISGRLRLRLWGYIFSGGFPSLVAELSSGIVMMVFNAIILKLRGNIGVAAYGVIANLSLVVIAVYTGIAQGVQPLFSKYYGRGETKKVQSIFGYAAGTVIILSGILYFGVLGGAEGIVSAFNHEGSKALQKIAVEGMKLYFTGGIFAGLNIILSIYCASTNKAKPAGIISVLRGFALIVPVTYLLSGIWGMTGLWLAFPVTELAVSLVGVCCMHSMKK
ncbi:MAG: MATE family efflux transporter [Bacteroidales bacterium]|nr:MATE family efflux transporter [Clostridium sp.]MCM1203009.1 MATE family efflux transporter [Bacteroidales bacterium]